MQDRDDNKEPIGEKGDDNKWFEQRRQIIKELRSANATYFWV